jgi:hypothetical protein
MPKNPDLEKVTLNLRRGDWEYLEDLLAPKGVATSVFVRTLVSRRVDELRSRETPLSSVEDQL